mgnify:CR=1 FL=1
MKLEEMDDSLCITCELTAALRDPYCFANALEIGCLPSPTDAIEELQHTPDRSLRPKEPLFILLFVGER